MTDRILVCTDLDRTLLPNGAQPESPHARERFAAVCRRDDIELAYVTGRHRELVMSALHEYALPLPDYVIGDVGTSIYTIVEHQWQSWPEWHEEIAASWKGFDAEHLASWLTDLRSLRLQEDSKQNIYKLSYYTPATLEIEASWAAHVKEHERMETRLFGTQGGLVQRNKNETYEFEAELYYDQFGSQYDLSLHPPRRRPTESNAMYHFVESIVNDTPHTATGEEGLLVMEILDAIYASAEQDRPIQIA